MKASLKENLWAAVGTLFLMAMFIWMFLYGTSAKVWYAGMHTEGCEKLDGKAECSCYERLLEQDAAMNK